MTYEEMEEKIAELEREVAFSRHELSLLGTSRQRMMRRTVQACWERDMALEWGRDLEKELNDIKEGKV
jgi:hypothetical protein